eukprot:3837644-Rhodomonas_salina.1
MSLGVASQPRSTFIDVLVLTCEYGGTSVAANATQSQVPPPPLLPPQVSEFHAAVPESRARFQIQAQQHLHWTLDLTAPLRASRVCLGEGLHSVCSAVTLPSNAVTADAKHPWWTLEPYPVLSAYALRVLYRPTRSVSSTDVADTRGVARLSLRLVQAPSSVRYPPTPMYAMSGTERPNYRY